MGREQRKKNYVDPPVQGALSRRLVVHWLLFLAASAAFAFFMQVLSDPFQPVSRHLKQMWWMHGPFLTVGLCLLPVFVNDTIKLSNRFAGPLYRIHQVVKQLGKGERPGPIRLRPNDFWHEFAADFNVMIERLTQEEVANGEWQVASERMEVASVTGE
jgi:hypothetical protein